MQQVSRVWVTDLGRLAYGPAWALQCALVAAKQSGQHLTDHLLLVEHEPVITLGRHADRGHILAREEELRRMGIPVVRVERGGDVTYHGPGQLVAYPILDLRRFRRDVRWYVHRLMMTAVRVVESFGVPAEARDGAETGVWLSGADGLPAAKIASVGVRIERWISYHGLALNVCPDLSSFKLIVPCGLHGAVVTSLAEQLGRPVGLADVKPRLVAIFGQEFGVELVPMPVEALRAEVG